MWEIKKFGLALESNMLVKISPHLLDVSLGTICLKVGFCDN